VIKQTPIHRKVLVPEKKKAHANSLVPNAVLIAHSIDCSNQSSMTKKSQQQHSGSSLLCLDVDSELAIRCHGKNGAVYLTLEKVFMTCFSSTKLKMVHTKLQTKQSKTKQSKRLYMHFWRTFTIGVELTTTELNSQFKFCGMTWYKLQPNSKAAFMWHCIMTSPNFTLRNAWMCGILGDCPSITVCCSLFNKHDAHIVFSWEHEPKPLKVIVSKSSKLT
jgi:hypothetical protein